MKRVSEPDINMEYHNALRRGKWDCLLIIDFKRKTTSTSYTVKLYAGKLLTDT